MNFPVQDTNAASVGRYPIFVEKDKDPIYYGTTGSWEDPTLGSVGYFLIEPRIVRDLTEDARYILQSIEDRNISEKAGNLLSLLRRLLRVQGDISYLPPLSAFNVEDGSLLIEWVFEHFRVGFSFETAIEESSWYIVSDSTLGDISAGGYLRGINLEQLLPWIINLVNQLTL
jgi:hypothetical protein